VEIIDIEHVFKHFKVSSTSQSDAFICTNKKGGFFLNNKNSRFRGLHFAKPSKDGWELFKTIDAITPNKSITKITNKLHSINTKLNGTTIEYVMENNSLLLDVSNKVELVFTFDCRKIYDFDEQNRNYKIYEEKNTIIIEYQKSNNYKIYIGLKIDCQYEILNNWREQFYEEEEKRNSHPSTLWVYDALKIICDKSSKIVICCNDKKEDVINNSQVYFSNFKNVFEKEKKLLYDHINFEPIDTNRINFAYLNAKNSVERLENKIGNDIGIYAGLPWFGQFWTRDESITLGALIQLKKYHFVKKVLMSRLNKFNEDGRLQNRFPHSSLGSADGTGWFWFRMNQFINSLYKDNLIDFFFTLEEIIKIRNHLEMSIEKQKKNFVHEFLMYNIGLETWMDTSHDGDTRSGYRIEIQSLWLRTLAFNNYLNDLLHIEDEEKLKYENATVKKVRETFFDGKILLDGREDPTIRPNIFLAHNIYPLYLSNIEWKNVFMNSLDKLWLNWGGVSTIDKENNLFQKNYTGENNISYHRGDSWYFLNNLTAISLFRCDNKLFQKQINKIIEASTQDILYSGVIGHSSEISSAENRKSEGSLVQAWSASTYIEMIKEIYAN
jgi:hypothetical protein